MKVLVSLCQCTDWLSATQTTAALAEVQHLTGIEPMSPDCLLPALTTQPLVCINA